jgi:serine/threonine-protein kinase
VSGLVVSSSVAGLALLALMFGGLTSVYVLMLAFYGIALGTFVPAHWRRMTTMLLPGFLSYHATLVIGVALTPALAPQLADPATRALFVAETVLVVGLSVFAVAGGHAHWRARTRLQDARRLGRYHLRSLLGSGGMNEVWRAFDTVLRREVALKLLRAHPADDQRRLRFTREAQATSALESPHTVRLYDFGASEDGTAWIVMELLHGRDLAALVETHGPLDPRRAVHFVRQAAASLAEAHERGIVHRDVKPANLFALAWPDHEDSLKLVDFGIARRLDADEGTATLVGTLVGTPAFMAPEQLAGAAADARSDVFALGATLYAILSGRLPFGREGGYLSARPLVPPHPPSFGLAQPLPPGLEALVSRLMAPDPEDRPADGAAVVAALAALDVAPWTRDEARAWWAEHAEVQVRAPA